MWLPAVALLLCLGLEPDAAPPTENPALRLWEQGQRVMLAGDTDGAIAKFGESLRLDPTLARNHLSLAAACLEKGADAEAADHMADYLRLQPDHVVVRLHHAELLLRLGRHREARQQFEQFVAAVQSRPGLADEHLLHCHSRLMEIAAGEEDEYAEHLHRGIGLYLLAKHRDEIPASNSEWSTEGLLCKAAGELTLAIRGRPEEARPCWYLSEVWMQLDQRRPAVRWLHAAAKAAPFSYLTPVERESLRLASRQLENEPRHR